MLPSVNSTDQVRDESTGYGHRARYKNLSNEHTKEIIRKISQNQRRGYKGGDSLETSAEKHMISNLSRFILQTLEMKYWLLKVQ